METMLINLAVVLPLTSLLWGLSLVLRDASIIGPLMMSIFLMKISGVNLLEKDISERRPEYEAYKRSTSPFFPGPQNRTLRVHKMAIERY